MKKHDHKKALILSIITVGYNVIEGFFAIIFGVMTGSSALLGFGFDSVAESLSGSIMIWRFAYHGSDAEEEKKERTAYKLVGYSFLILGVYVLYEALNQLISQEAPEPSLVGLIIAILSLLIMPLLFRAKYRLGKQIGSKSLIADSKQTLACMLMSVTLLIGLGLNYTLGLWWADPLAAIIISIFLLREGFEMKNGEEDY